MSAVTESNITEPKLRVCKECNKVKNLIEDFRKTNVINTFTYYSHYCKDCGKIEKKTYNREYYLKTRKPLNS